MYHFMTHDPKNVTRALALQKIDTGRRLPDDAYEKLRDARRFPFHRRAAGGEPVAKGEERPGGGVMSEKWMSPQKNHA